MASDFMPGRRNGLISAFCKIFIIYGDSAMKSAAYILCFAATVSFWGCRSQTPGADGGNAQAAQTEGMPAKPTVDDTRRATLVGSPDERLKAQIRETFQTFRQAVLRYDGKTASSMIARESLDYYANILESLRIKFETPDTYRMIETKMPTSVRTTVEIMSKRLTSSYAKTATPLKLYQTAFEQGWIGYRSMQTASIDDLKLYDREGQEYVLADFYTAGTVRDKVWARMGFAFEDGAWKIDLMPIFATVQRSIDDYVAKNFVDPEWGIEETARETVESSQPDQWLPYTYKRDGFGAKFPRDPLYAEEGGWRIYSSMHHILGQFDVRVRDYGEAQDAIYATPELQKQYIASNLKTIGAQSIRCRDAESGGVRIVTCNFAVPSQHALGKTVWYFAPQRIYLLFNIANESNYSEDAAASFAQGFMI